MGAAAVSQHLHVGSCKGITQPPSLLSSLQFCLAGRVKIFGFGLGENSQNVSQVARGVPDHLCASALQALAKSFSELQENTFVVRIAELRLGPLPWQLPLREYGLS